MKHNQLWGLYMVLLYRNMDYLMGTDTGYWNIEHLWPEIIDFYWTVHDI